MGKAWICHRHVKSRHQGFVFLPYDEQRRTVTHEGSSCTRLVFCVLPMSPCLQWWCYHFGSCYLRVNLYIYIPGFLERPVSQPSISTSRLSMPGSVLFGKQNKEAWKGRPIAVSVVFYVVAQRSNFLLSCKDTRFLTIKDGISRDSGNWTRMQWS